MTGSDPQLYRRRGFIKFDSGSECDIMYEKSQLGGPWDKTSCKGFFGDGTGFMSISPEKGKDPLSISEGNFPSGTYQIGSWWRFPDGRESLIVDTRELPNGDWRLSSRRERSGPCEDWVLKEVPGTVGITRTNDVIPTFPTDEPDPKREDKASDTTSVHQPTEESVAESEASQEATNSQYLVGHPIEMRREEMSEIEWRELTLKHGFQWFNYEGWK